MRSSRKRSVEPFQTTCLGVPGRPGTVSTRAWRLRRNGTPNLGQENSTKRACTHACSSRKGRGAGSPVAHTLPRPLQNPKKLGCGMVFKPYSCFLEQMLAMLRYPMRSSRKRSVEPFQTTCLGVPGRPGTVSTRAWRLRRNGTPNLGQENSTKRACTHACSSRKRRGAGSPVAHTLPRPLQNPKKLGCGMVFKPHSCFLEQMLAMLRYPMRSSRKRSVEPSRTTCLGVPGRPGTVSTRTWRLRRNRAPNLGQVHSAKRACIHACSNRKRRGAGSPVARTLPRPLQNPKKLGCGMVFKPHSCFREQMLAMLRYPMRSSRKRSVEPSRTTCLGVPGRPGTVSTRAWRIRSNRAPNLGQVHSAKRACTHACSSRKRRGAGSPVARTLPRPLQNPKKNWGAAWCLSPIRVF